MRLHDNQWVLSLSKSAKNELSADNLIVEIFEKSTVIEVTDEIISKAKKRVTLGNPPGKVGSYGDAINWECILTRLEWLDILHFISRDKDYASRIHEGRFNEFLERELHHEQIASVEFYPSLKSFIESRFPAIEIEAFKEAADAVQALEASDSFASTHAAIYRLEACENLSVKQVQRLVVAAENNHQVNWVLSDADLVAFFSRIESEYSEMLPKSWRTRLLNIASSEGTNETSSDAVDEIPF